MGEAMAATEHLTFGCCSGRHDKAARSLCDSVEVALYGGPDRGDVFLSNHIGQETQSR